MKRNSFINLFFLVVLSMILVSCGGGSPGAPGGSGSGETGCMILPAEVSPSTTLLDASDLTTSENVEVTLSSSDLPNQTGTCTGVTFTQYLVEYVPVPLTSAGPRLDNRTYNGTWFIDANTTATFTLTFWDYFTKLQYRYPKDPHLYHYNVKFTLTGYNVFGKKVTVPFQFEVTTRL